MPIQSYSVLKGRPTGGKVVSGASAHYQIAVSGGPIPLTVAVNIESVGGSEVLYAILHNFTPPDVPDLLTLPDGIQALKSGPGSLALDFVRQTIAGAPMITRSQMALLPIATSHARFLEELASPRIDGNEAAELALQNAVVTLLNQAVADPGATVYAFGSAFSDSGVIDGIHNIHMNQGNVANNHGRDNGIWQDGALFLSFSEIPEWVAVFIAFQTESWMTDEYGNPA